MRTFRLVERDPRPGCRDIQVEGEVDLAVADQLKEAIERASEHDQVLIGLQRCDFIDSTAIAVLVRAHQETVADGRRIAVYSPSSHVRRVLAVTGLLENGMVFDSAEQALAADGPEPR